MLDTHGVGTQIGVTFQGQHVSRLFFLDEGKLKARLTTAIPTTSTWSEERWAKT